MADSCIITITRQFGSMGRIVEMGTAEEVFSAPAHPYSRALMDAAPHIGEKKKKESMISGEIPSPIHLPSGCPFHPRCPYAKDICSQEMPPVSMGESGRVVRCHFPLQDGFRKRETGKPDFYPEPETMQKVRV